MPSPLHHFGVIAASLSTLLCAACGMEHPADLSLRHVHVADQTIIPAYKIGAARGYIQPMALIVELSTSETFPAGASIVDGFCGEKLEIGLFGDGALYRAETQDEQTRSYKGRGGQDSLRHYFAIINMVPNRLSTAPKYSIATDNHDICIQTSVPRVFAFPLMSNVVRVPRQLIIRALEEPPRQKIPLSTNQLE